MKKGRVAFAVMVWICAGSVAWSGGTGEIETAAATATDPDAGRVIVKFTDASLVRLRPAGLVSKSGRDLGAVRTVLDRFGSQRTQRLFAGDEEAMDRKMRRAELRSGRDLADLNGYYESWVAPEKVDAFLDALQQLETVETAYRAPVPVPPPGGDIPPTTPDYESNQDYLGLAPSGVDAYWAWTQPGGRGNGVTIIDIEYDWNDTHEDLPSIAGQELCFTPAGNFTNHGTAVMGEMAGGENGYGVTGIVPDASFGMVTQDPVGMSNSVSRAIECATTLLGPGDIILMETQSAGPLGLLPSEWNQDVFDAVSIATALGIVVVAAAGNGDVDLDDPAHLGRFDRTVRDSGAIIVGAGASPGAGQPDRSKLSFSTYGSRVDVQGWGHNVYTTGYGDLFTGGGDANQYYTDTFSGTSSASPIVTGAAAALQGVHLARSGAPLDPLEVRAILTDTGSPQLPGPFPGDIGPRPDLRAAIDSLPDLIVTGVLVDDAVPLGNGDGRLDPGETATLVLTMKNFGQFQATGVGGLLSTEESLVSITLPDASWPDIPSDTSADSLPAHHRVAVDPSADCESGVQFELQSMSNAYSDLSVFEVELGRDDSLPSADTPINIPKNSPAGAISSINVPDSFVVSAVRARVEVVHGDIGELSIELRSPSTTGVTLHDHGSPGTADLDTTYPTATAPAGPGTMDDFIGEPAAGAWELHVVDDQNPANGAILAWTLELEGCAPLSCAEAVPGAMDDSLRIERAGTDLSFTWDAQPGVTAYRVWESTTGFDSELMVGQTGGTGLVEVGGVSGSDFLTLYQVRSLNVCEWEGP